MHQKPNQSMGYPKAASWPRIPGSWGSAGTMSAAKDPGQCRSKRHDHGARVHQHPHPEPDQEPEIAVLLVVMDETGSRNPAPARAISATNAGRANNQGTVPSLLRPWQKIVSINEQEGAQLDRVAHEAALQPC